MRHFRPLLNIRAKTASEGIARAGDESEGKLALEHESGDAGRVGHGEDLEDERRGDLVGGVTEYIVDSGWEVHFNDF